MTRIICNASPIIGLSAIGQLDLLWQIFDEVMIPETVYSEVTIERPYLTIGRHELNAAVENGFIKVFQVKDITQVNEWHGRLHRGELEVVFGAMETGAQFVIIDDQLGRKFAHKMGLQTLGLVGILVMAKNRGFVHDIKPHLDQLLSTGYRISRSLYTRILTDAGEGSNRKP